MIGNSFDPFGGFHREEVLLGFPGVLLSKLFIGLEVGDACWLDKDEEDEEDEEDEGVDDIEKAICSKAPNKEIGEIFLWS